MRNIFPTPTARSGEIPTDHKNRAPDEPEEDFYYCKQCGYICKESRTFVGESGDGNGGVVITAGDPSVTAGCPFCGSFNSK